MEHFFKIEVYPFLNEIRFYVTEGETELSLTEYYENAEDDWMTIDILGKKKYDCNICYYYVGQDIQTLVSIYEVDENNDIDVSKPITNKSIKVII
jgi:hypothetical protein